MAARARRRGRVGGDGQSAARSALRFDPRSLTDVLVRAAGEIRLGETAPDDAEQLVARDRRLPGRSRARARAHRTRAASCSCARTAGARATGLRLALARGAALSSGMDEFYGRAMPAPPAAVPEERFVSLAQLYGRHALVLDDRGRGVRARPDLVVGDGSRAGDRAAAERERLVPRRRGSARRRDSRSHRRRDGRGGARGRGRGAAAERARHRGPRRVSLRRARRRRDHAHDRRRAHRPARRACCAPTARRSTACTPRARTPAGSRPAGTRAASRRLWSSAASPQRP